MECRDYSNVSNNKGTQSCRKRFYAKYGDSKSTSSVYLGWGEKHCVKQNVLRSEATYIEEKTVERRNKFFNGDSRNGEREREMRLTEKKILVSNQWNIKTTGETSKKHTLLSFTLLQIETVILIQYIKILVIFYLVWFTILLSYWYIYIYIFSFSIPLPSPHLNNHIYKSLIHIL